MGASFNLETAGPDKTGWVATAITDLAPLSIAVLAALQIVPAVSRLKEAPIQKIIVSDTINIDKNKLFDKLEIISVAEVFSEAIIRINKGDSISELFK
jgi:ribose-phosphate pyrophosphokinase